MLYDLIISGVSLVQDITLFDCSLTVGYPEIALRIFPDYVNSVSRFRNSFLIRWRNFVPQSGKK